MKRRTFGEVILGRGLPLDDCSLAFASIDEAGTVGELNAWVRSELGLAERISAETKRRLAADGYSLEDAGEGRTLILVVSLTAAGCVVFLACDDEYVVAALNAHYEKVAKVYGDGKVFGRRYLEKIVQISFRLPLLKNADIFELGIARMPKADESAAESPMAVASGGIGPAAVEAPREEGRMEGSSGEEIRIRSRDDYQRRLEVQLQEIVGDLMGVAIEPLGLNVRQAKSISNTVKLYLRIEECRTEIQARQVAAFVFADRVDQRWLDGLYHDVDVVDSPIGSTPELASRLAAMIGDDKPAMVSLFHLMGRRPGAKPSAKLPKASPRAEALA